MRAPDRQTAAEDLLRFQDEYGAKYPKAVICLTKDQDTLFTFTPPISPDKPRELTSKRAPATGNIITKETRNAQLQLNAIANTGQILRTAYVMAI